MFTKELFAKSYQQFDSIIVHKIVNNIADKCIKTRRGIYRGGVFINISCCFKLHGSRFAEIIKGFILSAGTHAGRKKHLTATKILLITLCQNSFDI